MSDRIDELWELVTSDFIDEQSRLIYARELDTIARESEARALKSEARALKAEAMCERLVKFAADCDECPRTRYDEDEDGCRECLDSIRRNAERVIRGE